MKTKSYQKTIENSIAAFEKGEIFFLENFINKVPDRNTIRVILHRLVTDSTIVRLAQGVFTKPKFSSLLHKKILPDADQVAHAIARRDRARIVYAGNIALNMLGLSTQVPMKVVYYTDGSPRSITLYDTRVIIFKSGYPKLFSYRNSILQLVVIGMRYIGKRNLEQWQLDRVKFVIGNIDAVTYEKDRMLIPEWIDNILLHIIQEES